jgi:hypothetical protein
MIFSFAQILNKPVYYFSIKMNNLVFVIYVSVDTSIFILASNILRNSIFLDL